MSIDLRRPVLLCAALSTVALVAACAPSNMAPQTVQASTPNVTYKYRGDQELLRANQQAAAYCNQYGTVPRTASLTNNTDGTNTVVFDCIKPTSATVMNNPMPPTSPALNYTYRTDRDLLDASRRADAYCMSFGQRMTTTSSIVTNADGTRTATFQCGPTVAVVP